MAKFVSVIIPARNEEKFIAKCLDSILSQDYPKEYLEVLAIDGQSEDNTLKIIAEYAKNNQAVKLLLNPKKITPSALNIGIKASKGEVIIRMDVHATYERDYISKCVYNLFEHKADNVGGVTKTLASNNSLVAEAIALSLSSFFGSLSDFRVGSKNPIETDTVFGGCYKREVFDRVGLFNENLKRSQDMEFNLRLKRAGGKILLIPNIISYYYPKENLADFAVHNFNDGIWAIYPAKFTKSVLSIRHYFPLASLILFLILCVFGLFFIEALEAAGLIVLLYILISLYFSLRIALKEQKLAFLFLLPVVFFTRHFCYAVGSLAGTIKILF